MFKKGKKGFTLIELMIVISIIAILATITLAGLGGAQQGARDTKRQQVMNAIRASLERYYGDVGAYPASGWANLFPALPAVCNSSSTGNLCSYMPSPISDPGCGSGVVADMRQDPSPCVSLTVPLYAYTVGPVVGATCTASATGYTLTLTKESGGKSYFCSPQ